MNQKSNTIGARRNPARAKSPGKSRNFPTREMVSLGESNHAFKIIVSTHETQGQRASDFCWVHDNEPLYLGFECDGDLHPDDRCGCHRSFCGMSLHKATTTAKVVEFTDGLNAITDMYLESMRRAGWFTAETPASELEEWRRDFIRFITGMQKFPVGAVLEKRGSIIQMRERKALTS